MGLLVSHDPSKILLTLEHSVESIAFFSNEDKYYVKVLGMENTFGYVTIDKSGILLVLVVPADSVCLFAIKTMCFVELVVYILAGVVLYHYDMHFWRDDNTWSNQDSSSE